MEQIREAHVFVVGKRSRTYHAAICRGDVWEFLPPITADEVNRLVQQMYQARYRYDSTVEILHDGWAWKRTFCEVCNKPVGIEGPVYVWNYAYDYPIRATICERCADNGGWDFVY